jgi:FtsP/CotA-like multicopper oxidase with cupredoxin domain
MPSARRGLALVTCAILLGLHPSDAMRDTLPSVAANDNRLPAGRLEAGVLTLHLELRPGAWRPDAPGDKAFAVGAFAEAGHEPQIPGPLIRVPRGTVLHVSVHNLLPVPAFVHGLDRHAGDTSQVMLLAPGGTKDARFAAGQPGTYWYWASTAADTWPATDVTMAGAYVVDAAGATAADRVFVIQVWVRHLYRPDLEAALTINGKSWPYTERLHARLGHPEHWRVVNASLAVHPMHLHGFYFQIDATGDGKRTQHFAAAERRLVVTETVLPGHTFEMTWTPDRPGNWLFHCHVLEHMTDWASPMVFGPTGRPSASTAEQAHEGHDTSDIQMAKLVMGVTVGDDEHRSRAADTVAPAAATRHLFVRERPADAYAPAGPGFYLEGVSERVGAIGPPLTITRGVRTAITVTNELTEPTAIHWHGVEVESYYDGVPGWDGTPERTTPAIAHGSSFVAYLTPPRAGTFIYHTHWHDLRQLTGGLYGALLVLEPGQSFDPARDKVFVLGRAGPNEMKDPLVLNGSPQPGLLVLLRGATYRFRLINITTNDSWVVTSLSSEGATAKWRPIAKDGADLPAGATTVRDAVQVLSVGETYDFAFEATEPRDYELRFSSARGSAVTQVVRVVRPGSPISVYAPTQDR